MSTFIILYIAKIFLVLMLVPLYREYRARVLRHQRVEAWRRRKFGKNNFEQKHFNF